MEKEFVSYPLALRMKQLKFDEPCFGYYVDGELRGVNLGIEELGGIKPYYQRFGFHTLSNHDIDNPTKIVVTAPTFSQAFRWFREKYDLNQSVYGKKSMGYDFKINGISDKDNRKYEHQSDLVFDSHEEAELECLQKLIEIVEQNKSE